MFLSLLDDWQKKLLKLLVHAWERQPAQIKFVESIKVAPFCEWNDSYWCVFHRSSPIFRKSKQFCAKWEQPNLLLCDVSLAFEAAFLKCNSCHLSSTANRNERKKFFSDSNQLSFPQVFITGAIQNFPLFSIYFVPATLRNWDAIIPFSASPLSKLIWKQLA